MALYNEKLRVYSTIELDTEHGRRGIQLLFGDITALPQHHAVDVLLISAFPGDYAPTRTSLVGALQHSLSIKVRELARDKEEDLRTQYHCWWSKPLPADKPFGRILCFEPTFGHTGRVIRHPAELVGEVFRCLVPVCNNAEKTVMSPLLATGDQNYSSSVMLRSMLEAAVNWIRAGLPMKCLSLVVYTRAPGALSHSDRDLAEMFDKFKTKALQDQHKETTKTSVIYDVYIAFHQEDKRKVDSLCSNMKENRKLKFFTEQQAVDMNLVWQTHIYNIMLACKRVVTFLSPAFMNSVDCIEKFNLALVCGRSLKREFLTPFLLENVTPMPTYVAMIQFIDCRTEEKLKRTMPIFLEAITEKIPRELSQRYDVFISYAHANTDCAQMFLNTLTRLNPSLSVFYDRNELKAGSGWQKVLYSALDNSEVVLALLSPSYLSSQVCSEEFSIALANHLSNDYESELLPVLIKEIENIPPQFSHIPFINAVSSLQDTANYLCQEITYFVTKSRRNAEVFHSTQHCDLLETLQRWRRKTLQQIFNFNDRGLSTYMAANISHQNSEINDEETFKVENRKTGNTVETYIMYNDAKTMNTAVDVAFITCDFKLAFFLFRLLKYRVPDIKTNLHMRTYSERMNSIDQAKLIVAFLCDKLEGSTEQLDELHVAIARHRSSKDRLVLYPIQVMQLPRKPTFFHLLPCYIALQDPVWQQITTEPETNTSSHHSKHEIIHNPNGDSKGKVSADHDVSSSNADLQDQLHPDPDVQMACKDLGYYLEEKLSLHTQHALSAAADHILGILMHQQSLVEEQETINNIWKMIDTDDGHVNDSLHNLSHTGTVQSFKTIAKTALNVREKQRTKACSIL